MNDINRKEFDDLVSVVHLLSERVLALEESLKAGSTTNKVEMMIRDKEYDRVCEEMKAIRDVYSGHQSWRPLDVERYQTLRKRKAELRKILGIMA